jgi:peptidoglycan/xylan/chitin deacetylase (PgdA/CDA1 family)
MKQTALKLLYFSGAFDLARLLNRRRAVILTYHRFSVDGDKGTTGAGAFTQHLEYLLDRYQVVSLSKLVSSLSTGESQSEKMAAITIDDGYLDAYEIAYPVLARYKVPATLFAVTGFIDRACWMWPDKMRYITSRSNAKSFTSNIKGSEKRFDLGDKTSRLEAAESVNSELKRLDEDSREKLLARFSVDLGVELPSKAPTGYEAITWDHARGMDAAGIEISSHTQSHPILTNCTDARLRTELNESRIRLEEMLGHRVEQFCYPNGNYSERVYREVARAGYRVAVTTDDGLVSPGDDPLRLKRVHTQQDLVHFAQSTSGFELLKEKIRKRGREDRNLFTLNHAKPHAK